MNENKRVLPYNEFLNTIFLNCVKFKKYLCLENQVRVYFVYSIINRMNAYLLD